MDIAKHYDPSQVENKWYSYWMENGLFRSVPDDREPYCIVIPPPNVTGVLHMGHMLNNTIQDVLVRRARMLGKNACWVPGTDHASIATEAKVVAQLKEQGITKMDLSREEFLKKAWDWTEKHGGIILEQLKKLGASCDWDRNCFTMDEKLSKTVIKVFVDLYNKGFIYRGIRMVNWDPVGKTAVSDEEVIHREVQDKLYYLKYKIKDSGNCITIATTRPETILGDSAVCLNPNDVRYKGYKGKMAIVPLINRPVPIIFDDYVDMEFGTGALKVTPAHDIHDYELGLKHHLDTIDILNDDGTLNENALLYIGEDRFVARDKIVKELAEKGFLEKTENLTHSVGFSERTNAVIEPKLSMQWYCRMDKMAKPALKHVLDDSIRFYPSKFKADYKHWMENITDWCISRQLWWGHRIPAWYDENGDVVVAETEEEAIKIAKIKKNLKQDEDVLDTWFSSWLWPISVFDGISNPHNSEINYYYPTDVLVTAPEILFFWVARMIMAGYEYQGKKPFKNVYLTGIVRDKQHRKMSKSLGNSPEPIELIEKYSADGVRVGMLLCSPAGNDLLFDEGLCEQGRSTCNKIWNAFRLINGWKIDKTIEQPQLNKIGSEWFNAKLNHAGLTINVHFSKYRVSDALMTVYKLIWDDFCSWYLEIIKPEKGKGVDVNTYTAVISHFETLLKLMHPFMPFISEEIWHLIVDRDKKECLMIAKWPEFIPNGQELISAFEIAANVISGIRNIRKQKNIGWNKPLQLIVKENTPQVRMFDPVIVKMCNLRGISYTDKKPEKAQALVIGDNEYFIPLMDEGNAVDDSAKLKSELEYTRGFLHSVSKKLGNDNFVKNAPQGVVLNERKKQTDAEFRIKSLEEQLAAIAGN